MSVRPYVHPSSPPQRLAQAYQSLVPASQRLAQASLKLVEATQTLAKASKRLVQASKRLALASQIPVIAWKLDRLMDGRTDGRMDRWDIQIGPLSEGTFF